MQRLIAIPILVLYLFVSIGIHGVSHFCGDEFVGMTLFEGSDDADMNCETHSCCSESMPVEEDCCDDIQFSVFYESERLPGLTTNQFDLDIPDDQICLQDLLGIEELRLNSGQHDTPETYKKSPPNPLYLQYHSLIFYG